MTLLIVLALAAGWLAVVGFALCLMAAAKRGDAQIQALSRAIHEDAPEQIR
jgi:hypothetical protein